MKLNTFFSVDKSKIIFFSNFFKMKKGNFLEDANIELKRIRNLWNENSASMEVIFSRIFNTSVGDIKIFIFPQYFYLGATETLSRVILFGQPSRTKKFPLAIIAHEIGHLFLSKIKFKRPVMVDEIICYMLEDYVYSVFDKKSVSDVWVENDLDLFHFNAMKNAIHEIEEKGPIVNRNIYEVMDNLINQLDKNTLNIQPEKGLIKNIAINYK